MSYLDWVMVALLLPCLLHKSTRASAFVLLLVFPFYTLTIQLTDRGMFRYMAYGTQDSFVCIIFLYLATKNIYGKMESCIAILAASAVIYHFLGWVARANGVDNTFYVNACIIIVTMQISMLYLRLIVNGILKRVDGSFILRYPYLANYYHGNKFIQKMQNKKV